MNIFEKNVPGTLEILSKKCVGVAGCGGLGSNAAVALVRAGVGKLILADFDRVEPSNLNRQYFFQSDVGKLKAEALRDHLLAINPEVELVVKTEKLKDDDIPEVFADADILLEAFDAAASKVWLIESWCEAYPEKPIVCGNGLADMGRSSEIKIKQVGQVYFCGDLVSGESLGLCSARVAMAANMEANTALALLTGREI